MDNKTELIELIDAFLGGKDESITAARKLEYLLEAQFPGDSYIQEDVIEALARYSPVGGKYLYSSQQLRPYLEETKRKLLENG